MNTDRRHPWGFFKLTSMYFCVYVFIDVYMYTDGAWLRLLCHAVSAGYSLVQEVRSFPCVLFRNENN